MTSVFCTLISASSIKTWTHDAAETYVKNAAAIEAADDDDATQAPEEASGSGRPRI
jgi:hypothetical protein